jgi:hypothetical protein
MTLTTLIAPLLIFLGTLGTAVLASALLAPSVDLAGPPLPTRAALRAASFGLPCPR